MQTAKIIEKKYDQSEILFLLLTEASSINITGSICDHEESGLKAHFPRGHKRGLRPLTR